MVVRTGSENRMIKGVAFSLFVDPLFKSRYTIARVQTFIEFIIEK